MVTKYQKLQNFYKGVTPGMAALGGALAGWFLSDTFVEAPRGQMTAAQRAEWERAISESRRKKMRIGKALLKDHAPVPPRQGLMWDPVKKRWTRPENVGHTVTEVQGKKRFRGTGTGIHEQSIATGGQGGRGEGSAEAGRRFRAPTDTGVARPHESKHASVQDVKGKKPTRKVLDRLVRRHKQQAKHKTKA